MMDEKEKRVREAARAHYSAQLRLQIMREGNTPTDPDERMAAYEAIKMAEAEESKAYFALLKAKSDYAD